MRGRISQKVTIETADRADPAATLFESQAPANMGALAGNTGLNVRPHAQQVWPAASDARTTCHSVHNRTSRKCPRCRQCPQGPDFQGQTIAGRDLTRSQGNSPNSDTKGVKAHRPSLIATGCGVTGSRACMHPVRGAKHNGTNRRVH